ncbi:GntR family transcriptional regulator [Granulicella sp. 5B5]|uniref:GntR family transcriptional regulator n=1 Tax=Granulicella sp. 5B5 TaxID=1617967 RepID=UPI0015F6978D|nr:GntR family transcriptional regulator [Granulicella sp. 5B5]QMV19437.1 GntR family transcriptional regulator [Granulicella sp. 5B5]
MLTEEFQKASFSEPPQKAVDKNQPKYRQIVDSLRTGITSGQYRHGGRLPSEAELVRRFGVSRMTAVKAVQQLQQEGLLVRRAGSGTYAADVPRGQKAVFGLIIPDLGQTEIFEPICKGMTGAPAGAGGQSWSLAWGHSATATTHKDVEAEQLCQQYIDQQVSGVFFAPLEFGPRRDLVNRRILKVLKAARIPVVLLDRCVLEYPARCEHDIVGLDNRRAGYVMAEHLIHAGAKRIGFFAREGSAETVDDRIAGCREALFAHGLSLPPSRVVRAEPSDTTAIANALEREHFDALLCANDYTAARLMRSLHTLGVRVPQDLRIAGFDDVTYAELLPVPLTTLHQPCLQIGAAAVATMLDRIANPLLPARSVLLSGHVVVRQSCGATQVASA